MKVLVYSLNETFQIHACPEGVEPGFNEEIIEMTAEHYGEFVKATDVIADIRHNFFYHREAL